MSRLITNSIRSTSASADAITLDGSGNATFPANVTCSGTASGFGGGKILQIVQGSYGSTATLTSSSYTDTGLTANITTSSSHAGVFVITNLAIGAQAANGGDAYAKFNIVRGSTQLRQGYVGKWEDNLSGHTHVGYWQPSMNLYDTGTSASTTYTYKCQYAKLSDATAVLLNQNAGVTATSYIFLIEVGA